MLRSPLLRQTVFRHLVPVLIAALVGIPASQAAEPEPATASATEIRSLLLDACAADFRAGKPETPVRVRRVRLGHVAGPTAAGTDFLCGEYQVSEAGRTSWQAFATIHTNPYEQWLGAMARGWCTSSKIRWQAGDLSRELQTRLAAPATGQAAP